jgi:hypothetical protein
MATMLLLKCVPGGFVPVTGWDLEQKALFPIGSVVTARLTKGKSDRMHRFYWAMVDMVAKGIGTPKDVFSDTLLRRTGRVDSYSVKENNGVSSVTVRTQSIAGMGHVEFQAYVDDAVDMIVADYIGDMPRGKLLSEVEKMARVTYADAFAPPAAKASRNDEPMKLAA